jgi:preprotein translocase subunit SecE
MMRNFLVGLVFLVVLAAVLWALDLVLTAVFNRLGVPEDIKRAARAIIVVIVFVFALGAVLHFMGFLPVGWW